MQDWVVLGDFGEFVKKASACLPLVRVCEEFWVDLVVWLVGVVFWRWCYFTWLCLNR